MENKLLIIVLIYLICTFPSISSVTVIANKDTVYKPTWESLDARPLPQWYDDAKIGIFLHWGVFSVPSFISEWFWNYWKVENFTEVINLVEKNYPEKFSYQEFAKDFTAEFFNPQEWAGIFKKSGAKYVVLTSKHHEGYTLWPSKYSFSWNSVDTGPHRDLVGELADAIRNSTDIHFGVYHSLLEWFNPMWLKDKASTFTENEFSANKIYPEMIELVEKYEPEILWSDGDWEAPDEYWKSKEFIAWLYNESPVKDVIVVNDRWGPGTSCTHGDFYTCSDRYNPGILQPHKWENAMTIESRSWGYRRNANLEEYLTTHDLLVQLAETVSCGGNLLMNVGPTKDGVISPIYQERLLDVGTWLSINGEAIYSSKPWKYQNDSISETWYTCKSKAVYAITLKWPEKNVLKLGSVTKYFGEETTVQLLGNTESNLKWSLGDATVKIIFPDKATVKSDWVWVVKISELEN